MGKNKKKRAQEKGNREISKTKEDERAYQSQKRRRPDHNSSIADRQQHFPLAFPPELPYPKDDFLRNEQPYQESFQSALNTAYEGFVVDHESSEIGVEEATIQSALESMNTERYFRADVTQPFGLGTPCAKTYVTRCVVGDRGTTYKYLGIRMFSYPWDGSSNSQEIHTLSDRLTERTKAHLEELKKMRKLRNAHEVKGRAGFDICLINRMEHSEDLKMEPSTQNSRSSVSWHADSSLEHYSTIAVYQSLKYKNQTPKKPKDQGPPNNWSVALRVARDSEGPQSSRRGTDIESSIVSETPPIAVSLESGSAYYLLDDFNHHHQHTVISNATNTESAPIRYSCTFRLLRHSHNVQHMIDRCQNTCRNFHKKGPKLWRSEGLLLTELESEWIRQFYIQGTQHRDSLWKFWREPMEQILKFWSQLEERCHQTIELLRNAAEGRCETDIQKNSSSEVPNRAERKARDRRKKALATVEELLGRLGGDGKSLSALDSIYQPFADLLTERARIRGLWMKREKDHVFHGLPPECRPIQVPFSFSVPSDQKRTPGEGHSPMSGSEDDLQHLGNVLLGCGRAFDSKNPVHLPQSSDRASGANALVRRSEKMHDKLVTTFALELQEPWALHLMEGRKTIETRAYPLPSNLIGKKIMILQSPQGKAGVSAMSDRIELNSNHGARIIGWCIFSRIKEYRDKISFAADESGHMVPRDSGYGWKDDTTVIYGWEVGQIGSDTDFGKFSMAVRYMRSLFELQKPMSKSKDWPTSNLNSEQKGKRQKKKRRF